MKTYYGYTRVSTVKQGEHGSSLQEQRAAIDAFAARQQFSISVYFEETETAAKLGRRQFNKMVAALDQGRASGVIIHKIDRSARNLKDWARLGELMDKGVEVHFAHDNMDLTTRGGRLAADLQAVVAADFIRNLRDEVKKGRYGRLKQGFWPMAAPIGYLDTGRARAKEIDPRLGPLISQAFELYASGRYSLHMLRAELATRGLRTRSGASIPHSHLARILHNPYYMGVMRVGTTGETFEGNHEPLVAKARFDRVQAILSGRLYPRIEVHQFLFRRLITCNACNRSLTGERQKGRVYYRCHNFGCRGVSIPEHHIDALVRRELGLLRVDDGEVGDFREVIAEELAKEAGREDQRVGQIARDLALIEERLVRLTDAVLDGTIDKPTYDERKASLVLQKLDLHERQKHGELTLWQIIAERFEQGITAQLSYESGTDDEKRRIIQTIGSNFVAHQKDPVFPMFWPYQQLREWSLSENHEPVRVAVRTLLLNLTAP